MGGRVACWMRWRPSAPGRRPEVGGFLDQMALGSRERANAAMSTEPLEALRARCADLPRPTALARSGGFDLIAELKLRSPALGDLGDARDDLDARVTTYARAGAAAVSVLTEPSRFSGSLAQLEAAAAALAPLSVPAMRKDFLVDPYQLYEARASGAGGALLIVRMLSRGLLVEMLDCARELGLFVLIETFDEADIDAAVEVLRQVGGGTPVTGQPEDDRGLPGERVSAFRASGETPRVERAAQQSPSRHLAGRDVPVVDSVLLGVNSRDLQTLTVVPERLEQLAARLPRGYPRVAESGLTTPEDAARMARAGYDMALVGGALMAASDPGALVAAMLAAGRSAGA